MPDFFYKLCRNTFLLQKLNQIIQYQHLFNYFFIF